MTAHDALACSPRVSDGLRGWLGPRTVVTVLVCVALYTVMSRQGASSASLAGAAGQAVRCSAAATTDAQLRGVAGGAKVLVTGAAGFIGSHVARYAAMELGLAVIGVDDLSGGTEYNMLKIQPANGGSFRFVMGNLQDEAFVKQLFVEHGPFVHVYHLAAYAAEGLSHFIRSFNYGNNLVASMHVLNAAVNSGTKTFVFTSSIAVYGAGQTPLSENTVPQPEDPYGVAKYAVELDLRAAHEMFGIDFVVFRPHNVYGPGQNVADKYRNVIGIFMRQMLTGEPMTVFGDGSQTRAFSYIDDVAPFIARAPLVAGARNQVFNVGADRAYSLNELAAAVGTAMGAPGAEVRHLPARKEVQHAVAAHGKLACVFGPAPPLTTLAAGLASMAAWATDLHARGVFTPVEYEGVEVPRGLPPSWVPAPPAAGARICTAAARTEIAQQYARWATTFHDITEHIPLLRKLARNAVRTTELGVRDGVAAWAFAAAMADRAAAGLPAVYRAVDVDKRASIATLDAAMAGCPGVDYAFFEGNELAVWESDFLLIDTWHVYKQIIKELPRWAPHVTTHIAMHDTSLFGEQDEQDRDMPVNHALLAKTHKTGLWTGLQDFLSTDAGSHWRVMERRHSSNGLTVLERVKPESSVRKA